MHDAKNIFLLFYWSSVIYILPPTVQKTGSHPIFYEFIKRSECLQNRLKEQHLDAFFFDERVLIYK